MISLEKKHRSVFHSQFHIVPQPLKNYQYSRVTILYFFESF